MYKMLWRKTTLLWLFSMVKLPMIFWLKPKISELSDKTSVITIRFRRRTKNHVNSMYFGVLCVGAELAAGVLAMNLFQQQKEKFTFLFKDFSAEFLKRCESDVYFICNEGNIIAEAIKQAKETQQRQNVKLQVRAITPSQFGDESMCQFNLTLSLKQKV